MSDAAGAWAGRLVAYQLAVKMPEGAVKGSVVGSQAACWLQATFATPCKGGGGGLRFQQPRRAV